MTNPTRPIEKNVLQAPTREQGFPCGERLAIGGGMCCTRSCAIRGSGELVRGLGRVAKERSPSSPPDAAEANEARVIRGYPQKLTVVAGETIELRVATDAASFRVDFYRQGKTLERVAR